MSPKSYSLVEDFSNGEGILEQYTVTYDPINVSSTKGVTIEQYEPDDDPAWQTLSLLTRGFDLGSPGDDEVITRYFKAIFRKPRLFNLGTVFVNPCAIVRSKHPTDQFFRVARSFQEEWFRRINDICYSAARGQRHMATDNGIIRQLRYTGVLVVAGRHIFPDRWPDAAPEVRGKPFGCGRHQRPKIQAHGQATIHTKGQS